MCLLDVTFHGGYQCPLFRALKRCSGADPVGACRHTEPDTETDKTCGYQRDPELDDDDARAVAG